MKKRLSRIAAVISTALLCLVLTACVASISGNQDPVASFTTAQEDGTYKVTFDASSSFDLDGEVVLWNWSFGDDKEGSGVTVTHTYASHGPYSVCLVVRDDDGASDEITKKITVEPESIATDPIAFFRPRLLQRNQTGSLICFDSKESEDPDGKIVWGRLDFGDGSTAEGPWTQWGYDANGVWTEISVMRKVTYLYTIPGSYIVILTVMDNDGNRDSTSRIIKVRPYSTTN